MGTTASPILTGTGLATFNGSSTYAGSLQNEISRAVSIASLPLDDLETSVQSLQGQTGELSTLQSDFTSILTSLQSLDSSSGGSSLAASVSDSTVATATVNGSAAVSSGTYTVNITSPGSPETTLSNSNLPTVTDPSSTSISTATSYTLTVGTSTFTVNPSSDTLNALAQAINGANAGVSATILNLGSPSSPNYQLSLQSTSLGDVAIQLNDGSDLLSTLATGTPATYQINGLPSTPISSNSSTVTIAPGVSVDLLKAGQATVTVAPDPTAAESALSAFVTAYNTTQTELNNNHGTAGGALTGQSIVNQLSQSLSSLINYSGGSGNITSLTQLGVTFSSSGQLQFDQGVYESAVATDPTDVANFLGSASGSGTGFLGTASNLLNGLTDSSKGLFATTDATYTAQINTDNSQISADTQRIETMQNDMVAQMSQADALIASLQSQVSYYTTLFQDTQNAITNGG